MKDQDVQKIISLLEQIKDRLPIPFVPYCAPFTPNITPYRCWKCGVVISPNAVHYCGAGGGSGGTILGNGGRGGDHSGGGNMSGGRIL